MQSVNECFDNVKEDYFKFLNKEKILGKSKAEKIKNLKKIYIPISFWIENKCKKKGETLILGFSGGQGSGKTTVTGILKIILKKFFKRRIHVSSIDDFYKTLKDRNKMSHTVHPLLKTRGVPGTHDINLIKKFFNFIKKKKFKKIKLPKFDKSIDDRLKKKYWFNIKERPEIVILEGWCVGAQPQPNSLIKKPINVLEKYEDQDLTWRKYVNEKLKREYKKLFKMIDCYIFMKIPNFNMVFKWRLLQENKLRKVSRYKKKIMSQQPFKIVENSQKQLPNNIEAEQAVIASILVSNDIYDEISPILNPQKFFDPIHVKLYETIEKLISKGLLANPITLKNHFENNEGLKELGGQEYLIKITKFSTSVKQAIDYANIVQEMHVRRELIKISQSVLDEASTNADVSTSGVEIIQNAEKSLFDLAERGHFNQSFIKFESALKQTIEMAKSAYQNDEGIVGVPTGLTDLDARLGGMHKQDLIIIAGRPSMGKTALATNIAFHAAKNIEKKGTKSTVAFFSLEMSSEQLSTRILSEQSKIRSNDIRRGKVSEKEFEQFIETSKNIYDLPLYIDETPAITIAAISNRARRIKRLFGLELIVVDYIQLMRSSGRKEYNRVQEISEITQGLKALAKELDVPVLALSQLSRQVEQRDNKKPQLSDLRESGSIEQDADVVMFVYREAYYLENKEPTLGSIEHAEWRQKMDEISRLADIMIGKQRHGPTGNIKVEFEAMYTKFKDLENK